MKQNLLITTAFAVMLSTVSAAELRIATVDLNEVFNNYYKISNIFFLPPLSKFKCASNQKNFW